MPPLLRKEGLLCYSIVVTEHIHNLSHLLITRRNLRNNATKEENDLWLRLKSKNLGYKFRRQHGIGNFIIDFYCPLKKLAIEIDGKQHLHNKEHDNERSEYLHNYGIKILRFGNDEVTNSIEKVIDRIKTELESK